MCEPDRKYASLDDPALRTLANEDPALFLQRFSPPVLIDEIQYAPQLLPFIKLAVDEAHEPGGFSLTGSQQFHMMKGVSETLAGRVAIMHLLGFSGRERRKLERDVPPFLPTAQRLTDREASGTRTTLHGVYEDIWTGTLPALVAGPAKNRDLFYSFTETKTAKRSTCSSPPIRRCTPSRSRSRPHRNASGARCSARSTRSVVT